MDAFVLLFVYSARIMVWPKGAGIELTILVNIFVLKLATHAHNANREMNFFNLIGGYFLGELS